MSSSSPAPTDAMRFRWPWRPSQQRVLEAFEAHAADGRLHVVAAPGAGKTSLGLELVRRLRRPALVLAPTRTIRDQWLLRLGDFLQGREESPPWTSSDLDVPGFLTVATYQALHTRTRRQALPDDEEGETAARPPTLAELQEVVDRLRAARVGTLVLDEAHHLRQEWWRALTRLVEGLEGVRVVALTATPPFDVTGREWARYEELCGPIDEEISVPELVRAGTLCPHQDFVLAVAPTGDEAATLRAHDQAVERLCADLLADAVFLRMVEGHAWLSADRPDPESVLERPELAAALLVLQHARGKRLPRGLLDLLGCRQRDLPPLDRGWWQELVAGYLGAEGWPLDEALRPHRKALRQRLRREGLLWRRELRIAASRTLTTTLSLSRAKIEACLRIHARERELRGDDLRQVILADFIGDQDLGAEPTRLGAWPVFQALAAALSPGKSASLALLTGRLAIVSEARLAELRALLGGDGDLAARPLAQLRGFVRVDAPGARLVRAFTQLFEQGQLEVLVGTRALLGEGWDAPALNSLVLASYVGSFMTTNQMRGRAIRSDKRRPDKVASIWHLVAIEPATPSGRGDLDELERRFATFLGLSAAGTSIESGLARLDLPPLGTRADLDELAARSFERLGELPDVAARWHTAVEGAAQGRVLPTLLSSPRPEFKTYILRRTLWFAVWETVGTFLFVAGLLLRAGARHTTSLQTLGILMALAGTVGFLVALPGFGRVLVLLLRHLPVDGSVRQIALALRDALCAAELLETPRRQLQVLSRAEPDGSVSVALSGGGFREHSLFVDCLAELLGPIESPRYLLTRHGRVLWRHRTDYHAVPRLLGVNKDLAALLHARWRRRIGRAELHYTRNGDGRRLLLEARLRAFSSALAPRAERTDRWH